MRKTYLLAAFGTTILLLTLASVMPAQDVVLPGSTVQGDILRGQGQFLKGAAWYEYASAQARNLDAQTARTLYAWEREVYETYLRERAYRAARKQGLTRKQQELARQKYEAREAELRTNPRTEDVQRGDALNALLVDLSNPSISESQWRRARVDLPADLAIRELIFRFAPRLGDRNSQAMSKGLIVLGRLDLAGRWPPFLQLAELESERKAYETAYSKVRGQSMAGALGINEITALDSAVSRLKSKVRVAVPENRGFRAAAERFVADLEGATKMFDAQTIGFAQEMISDTQRHQAKTVAELLAFMRKYRLLFASAERVAGGDALYSHLFRLLKQQKEALGNGAGQALLAPEWVQLFNGRDLSNWRFQSEEGRRTWTVKNGILQGNSDGPHSYLFTERADYQDFEARIELRLISRGHTGFCFRMDYFDAGAMANRGYRVGVGLHPEQKDQVGTIRIGAQPDRRDIEAERAKAAPEWLLPGEWVQLHVTMVGNQGSVRVNGKEPRTRIDTMNLHPKGHIGLQIFGVTTVEFRKVEIHELSAR